MNSEKHQIWTRAMFILLMAVAVGLSIIPRAFANQHDVKQLQDILRDKGYDPGPSDGVMGAKTRDALSQYQQAQGLPVTGHVDPATADKLGVGKETEKGDFKTAGKDVGRGGEGVGHEMKQGKPIAAGKDLGEGVGKGSKKVGQGVKKAVSPRSDANDPEKKP